MGILRLITGLLSALFANRAALAVENLALRQQLLVVRRSVKRPKIRLGDRVFWVWLSRIWEGWQSALLIVQPETVIGWHRQGFKLYWRWKSRRDKTGRLRIDKEVRDLIRRMSRDNSTWGVPRIQAELRLLGHDLAESTVTRYIDRTGKPPSPTWRAFLKNHASQIAAIDFFTVPTISFKMLYCMVILRHGDRKLLHVNVTAHPTAQWAARQVVEACPFETPPRFLLRDRDGVYGEEFRSRIRNMGIEEVVTAYRSPWQNAYAERVIGSIRRECLDHMIILNEDHLKRVLDEYVDYYNLVRPHQSLDRNSPEPRETDPPENGRVVSTSYLGGLHHRYNRAA